MAQDNCKTCLMKQGIKTMYIQEYFVDVAATKFIKVALKLSLPRRNQIELHNDLFKTVYWVSF